MEYKVSEGVTKTQKELRREYDSAPYWVRQMVSFQGWCKLRKSFKTDIQTNYKNKRQFL